jgi:hypothetical protein
MAARVCVLVDYLAERMRGIAAGARLHRSSGLT